MERYAPSILSTLPVVALAAVLSGCPLDRQAAEAGRPAVEINDESIPYGEFEQYLQASFGPDTPAAADSETRSRLFDQFVEERLLLQKAKGEGVRVDDDRVESYLADLGGDSPDGKSKPAGAPLKEQVRRSLMIQVYKDRVLLREVKVEPEEIETYFREHPEEFRESRAVVLRQILLDDAGEARRLADILKADPGQFPVLARQNSIAPDRGQPRQYEEEELPEQLRAPVFALAPGEISEPLEDAGKVRIFQAVDQHEGKNLSLPEAKGKIRLLLLQRRAEETLARALADLKKEARIRVHLDHLPFHYQGEYGS